jgi:hypothetical protein
MTEERDNRTVDLAERVTALELALASKEVAQRRGATQRLLLSLSYVIPVLAFAGWAVAQTEQPLDGPVRKVGDITQVTAPFEVVDASGTVILGVGSANGAVRVLFDNDGGAVEVHTASGARLVDIGADSEGNGDLIISTAGGAALAHIGRDGFAVHSKSGDAVAVLTHDNAGAGRLHIADGAAQRVVEVGADATGRGYLDIKSKNIIATSLTANAAGAGHLVLNNAQGGLGLEASGFPSTGKGIGRGGRLAVANEGGVDVLVIGSTSQGKGQIALGDETGTLGELYADDTGGNLLLYDAARQMTVNAMGGATGGGSIIASSNSGELLASLGPSAEGKGSVLIFDGDHVAAELSADTAGVGTLTLSNAAGKSTLEASGDSAGGGGVNLSNNAGDLIAILGSSDGRGSLSLVEKGIAAAELMSDSAGAGGLVLRNAAGEMTLNATGDSSGGGSILASNGSGDPVATFGSSGSGQGAVQIIESGNTAAELTGDSTGAGWLLLHDAAGKVAVEATGADQAVGIGLYRQGQLVAGMGASQEGRGQIAVHGKSGWVAELAEGTGGHGIVAVTNSNNVVVAGVTGAGEHGGAVIAMNSTGATTAQLSTTSYGEGQLGIYDPGGTGPWAIVSRDPEGGGGVVQVMSATQTVGSFMAKPTGGGYLQLLSSAGNVAVEAGAEASGRGVVRAGPRFKCQPGGGLGLTLPDCIVGLP